MEQARKLLQMKQHVRKSKNSPVDLDAVRELMLNPLEPVLEPEPKHPLTREQMREARVKALSH